MPKGNGYDSVKLRKSRYVGKTNPDLLLRANQAWENLRKVREVAERTRKYCNGDQWGDIVTYKHRSMTEREYIQSKGQVPLTNNIMSSILTSIVGIRAKQETEPVCFARTRDSQALSDMMSATLQTNWQTTQMEDFSNHLFRDFLQDGFVMARECWKAGNGKSDEMDSWTEAVPVNYGFFEIGSDPRHNDIDMIGVLHDTSPEDLYFKFAKPEFGLSVADLKKIYHIDDFQYSGGMYHNDLNKLENVSFDHASDIRKLRVIEVWTKEIKQRYQCFDPIAKDGGSAFYRCELDDKVTIAENKRKNIERKQMYDQYGIAEEERAYITMEPIVDEYWYFTFLAPDGTVLCEGETPYDNHDHPFTLKLYPYSNGEIHPFMSNIIDQQRYINRLIMLQDLSIKAAAKGHIIVPIDNVPDGDLGAFAESMTSFDDITFYEVSKKNPNARPDILTSNVQGIGTTELLQMQLNLIRDISNVSGALQGKTPSAGTSAQRYAMESSNSTTSLYPLLKDFQVFIEALAEKKVELIKQFYEDDRCVFERGNTSVLKYKKLAAEDVKFKISIREAGATAAFAQEANDTLNQLFSAGAITAEEWLQELKMPFADSLLQAVRNRIASQQVGANGQVMGANQQAVAQAEQMLGRPQQYA